MEAGVLATLLAMAVGVPLGLVAGYYRGWPDLVISRFTDLLLAFPFLILAVGLAAILGPSLRNVVIALGISALPSFIRVTRGEVLGLREQDYVAGAIADGAGDVRILRRYILPNALSPLLVQATVTVPEAIIGESVLSFLGLGVQPPTPSWGTMLSAAQAFLSQAPLLAVWPGLAIALAALSFNLVGDGLRDALDPQGVPMTAPVVERVPAGGRRRPAAQRAGPAHPLRHRGRPGARRQRRLLRPRRRRDPRAGRRVGLRKVGDRDVGARPAAAERDGRGAHRARGPRPARRSARASCAASAARRSASSSRSR